MAFNQLDPEDVRDDIVFQHRGDKALERMRDLLREEFLAKGLIYYEIAFSKWPARVKYLIKSVRPGETYVLDLDTNQEVRL